MLKQLYVALLLCSWEFNVLVWNAELLRSIVGVIEKYMYDLQHLIREVDYFNKCPTRCDLFSLLHFCRQSCLQKCNKLNKSHLVGQLLNSIHDARTHVYIYISWLFSGTPLLYEINCNYLLSIHFTFVNYEVELRKIVFIYSENHLTAINILLGKIIWFLNFQTGARC